MHCAGASAPPSVASEALAAHPAVVAGAARPLAPVLRVLQGAHRGAALALCPLLSLHCCRSSVQLGLACCMAVQHLRLWRQLQELACSVLTGAQVQLWLCCHFGLQKQLVGYHMDQHNSTASRPYLLRGVCRKPAAACDCWWLSALPASPQGRTRRCTMCCAGYCAATPGFHQSGISDWQTHNSEAFAL